MKTISTTFVLMFALAFCAMAQKGTELCDRYNICPIIVDLHVSAFQHEFDGVMARNIDSRTMYLGSVVQPQSEIACGPGGQFCLPPAPPPPPPPPIPECSLQPPYYCTPWNQ